MKKIAILQSNYIPWKGVFDMINQVDTFVFLEDVQYTTRDWRNRNRILTENGAKWITVPIKNKERRQQLICEAEININENWQKKHLNSFNVHYSKSPFYKDYRWILDDLYQSKKWNKISDFNIYAIKLISKVLKIKIEFKNSTELHTIGCKDDKLIDICKSLNATHYLSGPAAQNYIMPEKFEKANIQLEYMKYEYPRYNQLYEPFNHYVTILDLIFNCGQDAPYYIWGWREEKGEVEYDTL